MNRSASTSDVLHRASSMVCFFMDFTPLFEHRSDEHESGGGIIMSINSKCSVSAQIKSPKSLSYAVAIHVPFSSSSLFALKLLLALSNRRTFRAPKSPIMSRDDDDADSEPKNLRSRFVLRRLSHFSNNFSNSLSHFALNLRKLF